MNLANVGVRALSFAGMLGLAAIVRPLASAAEGVSAAAQAGLDAEAGAIVRQARQILGTERRAPVAGNSLLNTGAVLEKADRDLLSAIRDFERLGGSGGWFESVLPDKLTGEHGYFYLVTSLPGVPKPEAKIFLLRTRNTLDALTDVIVREAAPVVFGNIPERSQVFAAALGGYQLALDTLRHAGRQDKKNIILLTPNTSVFTLAHENRHWLDYEDANFVKQLNDEIQSFATKNDLDSILADILADLSPDAPISLTGLLSQITLEIRGHIVQARQARNDLKRGHPYVDRAGNIRANGLQSNYVLEQNMARQFFEQAYLGALSAVFSRLNQDHKRELLAILAKYDSSNDSENKITFRKVLGIR